MARMPKSVKVEIEPEVTADRIQRALRERADELAEEAAAAGPGTFQQLLAARISLEFRLLASKMNYK